MSFRNQAGTLEIQMNGTIKRLPFFQGTNLIGRNPNKTNISIKDRSISEIHAKLICKDHIIKIIDNNSKNGVYLNTVENQLKAGDEVLIDCRKDIIFLSTFQCKIIPEWQQLKNKEEDTMGIEQQTLPDKNYKQKKNQSIEKEVNTEKQTKKMQAINEQNQKKDTMKIKQSSKQENKKEKIENQRATKNIKDKSKDKENIKEANKTSKNKKKQEIEIEEEDDHQKHINKKKKEEKDDISKEKKNSQQKKKKGGRKKTSLSKKQQKEENIEVAEISKKLAKEKKSTQKMNKNTKKNKRPSSEETLAKNKKKGRHKSLNKIENKQPEMQARKKMVSDENPYFMRNLEEKSALLSNCSFAFVPSVRIKLIKEICEQFDVLVMDKFLRTFKLLYAVLKGKPIVSSSWVLQSQFKRKVMPVDRYFLEGPQKKLIFQSVEKVKSGNRVFEGLKFLLISEQYHLKTEQIEELIELGGGQVLKPKQKPSKNTIVIVANEYGHSDLVNAKNLSQCQKIYKVEMILDSCLRQQIDWNSNQVPKL